MIVVVSIVFLAGGILGLFTGISILSMVEVAFWVLRFLTTRAHSQERKIQ